MDNSLLNEKKRQALAHLNHNRLQEARDLFFEASQIDPQDMETLVCLAQLHAQLGQPQEVAGCCRRIIAIHPDSVDARYHLACALILQGKLDEAADEFQRVLQINPDHALACLHLGKTFHLQDRYDEALSYYRRTAALAPGLAAVHGLIGGVLQRRGNIDGAVSGYRQALHLQPDAYGTHSDLVMALNYSTGYDAPSIYAEHLHWGRTHKLGAQPTSHHPNVRDPQRRLRIGYVSPNLYRHSVAFFFEPLLANHDPAQVETYCYAEVDKPDATTEKLRAMADHWTNTCGMSDAALAARIQSDRIDILVDLAGHTDGHRLLAFTAKPAPIQVTYLGYPNTTGIAAMDYRFTDAWADPPGTTEVYHTETLVRLPQGFLCYRAPEDVPPVKPLPAATHGSVTFGSFNNLTKINPQVVSVWAAILRSTPGARLVMKNCCFGDVSTREIYRRMFAEHGIPDERLELLGPMPSLPDHMRIYDQIDIALDTFPYNGTTTTCEALWMGVPLVTLAGSMHAGRVGVSLLSQAGLDDLIAPTTDEYIRIAVELARNPARLTQLRETLRERIANSKLCDERTFAESVEQAYRTMWVNWCGTRTSVSRASPTTTLY